MDSLTSLAGFTIDTQTLGLDGIISAIVRRPGWHNRSTPRPVIWGFAASCG